MAFPSKEWLVDALERTVMTGLVAFATAWLIAPSLDHDVVKAAALAGLTAAVTFGKTVVMGLITGTPSAVGASLTKS